MLLENENGSNAVWNIATQAVLTGQAQSASQIAAAVDSVSTSDVRSVSCFIMFIYSFNSQNI